MSSLPLITVITPSYNRAHTLRVAYESLLSQTHKEFIWLIVDDGSTDESAELIKSFISEGKLDIRYQYQTNQGFHIATNLAINLVNTEYVIKLDSDDALAPTALERYLFHWNNIPEERRTEFCAVKSLCCDETGALVGDRFPEDVWDSNTLIKFYQLRLKGDKKGLIRAAAWKEFPFATESFGTSYPWLRMARKYQTRYVNEMLYIYYRPRLRGDTVTSSAKPNMGYYRTRECLNNDTDYLIKTPFRLIQFVINYNRRGISIGKHLIDLIREVQSTLVRSIVVAMFLPSYLYSWYLGKKMQSQTDNK